MKRFWMLPEDVMELLPEEALAIERLRRLFLDKAALWGYRLVMPPLIEFLDALLAGSENLDVQTFKITDHESGRLMGVRADFTPQIARIDAHRLQEEGVARFAYCGDVLRTKSESTQPRRNPLIAGAELYGVEAVSGDVEVMALLLDYMSASGLKETVINIGHSGIFAGLVALYQLNIEQRTALKDIFMGLRRPDLSHWQQQFHFSDDCLADIAFLMDAPLQVDALSAIRAQFFGRHVLFDEAIEALSYAQDALKRYYPNQSAFVDVSNIGAYGYHSGLVFALYAKGHYDALARGGRYDGLGAPYGRARAATGFSVDLLTLGQIVSKESLALESSQEVLLNDVGFEEASLLRASGKTVVFKHGGE